MFLVLYVLAVAGNEVDTYSVVFGKLVTDEIMCLIAKTSGTVSSGEYT